MFADPYSVPVVDGTDASEKTEDWFLNNLDGNNSVRYSTMKWDATAKSANPGYFPTGLQISHTKVGTGINLRRRHMVKFTSEVYRDGEKTDKLASVYLVADLPETMDNESIVKAGLWQRITGILYGASAVTANSFDLDAFWNRFLAGES